MSYTYENQGESMFLIYAMEEGEQLDSMSVGKITKNNIPGLTKIVLTQMYANRSIKYNVSSQISVKQFLSGTISKKRLLSVCQGIVDAMLSAEEHTIDPNMLVLDTEHMFANVPTGEITLICLPVIRQNPQRVDPGAFFKHIVFTTQHDQTEDCDYVAKIINYLNSTPAFSLRQFKGLLTEIGTAASPAPAPLGNAGFPPAAGAVRPDGPQPQVQPAPAPAAPKAPPVPPTPPAQPARPAPSAPPAGWTPPPPSFGAPAPAAPSAPPSSIPVVPAAPVTPPPAQGFPAPPVGGKQAPAPGNLGGAAPSPGGSQRNPAPAPFGQTQPVRQPMPHLIRKRSGEKISITKPVFRLGRDIQSNDYPITDNIYVSNNHCHIVSRGGEYFIVDNGSKNHTSVDGASIPSGQEVRLTHGCRLVIANEEFEFRLY